MRVTNRMLYSHLVKDIGVSTDKMLKLNTQVSSGKRIIKPSDDPIGMSIVLQDRTELSGLDQNASSINYANGLVTQTESVFDSITDLLDRTLELATSQSAASASAQTRTATAAEVREILGSIYSLANTQYNGKYIFGGTRTDTAPFLEMNANNLAEDVLTFAASPPAGAVSGDRYIDTDNNHIYSYDGAAWTDLGAPAEGTIVQVTDQSDDLYVYSSASGWQTQYQGNNDTFNVKIGKTDMVKANIPGNEIFRNDDGDIFKTIMNFQRALESNDQTGIQAAIAEIWDAKDVISNNLAIVGARMNRFDYRETAIASAEVTLKAHKSAVEDVDYAEAVTALENQTTIYEATLKSASMITRLSLVDYIS